LLTDTVVPWVLGVLLLITLLALTNSIKNWREIKRSPYFFIRRQAEKRLQTYLSASCVSLLVTVGFVAIAWQTPADTTPRVALLANSKPPRQETVSLLEGTNLAANAVRIFPEAAENNALVTADAALVLVADDSASAVPQLPSEYDRFDPTVELNEATELGALSFSTEIDRNYEAVQPRRIFGEGFYTVYATFSYDDMANGMEWAWVWRHNRQVVDGGNELWAYGEDGPGYIYFSPQEGFQPGQYELAIWVNGELMNHASIIINSAAISAGN
jgi:hypothetical protein